MQRSVAMSTAAFTTATADFGVVIPSRPEHLHWAKGTCASVRYYMPGTPICILLDGSRRDAPTDLEAVYGVQVICRDDVEHHALRDTSFGSLNAKGSALWLSPFETYLLLDADAVVWGDLRRLADFDRFDFVIDTPIGDRAEVRKSVMDAAAIAKAFPDFDARAHVDEYVNTGTYFGRRGVLDLERYLEFLRFKQRNPGLVYGDQGPFNFMLFGAADEGRVRVRQRPLQVLTGRSTRESLARRFAFSDGRPVTSGEPVVLHWVSSPKPRVREGRGDYFAPMTFFRLRFRVDSRGGGPTRVDVLRLRFEDAACKDFRGRNLRGRWHGLRRRWGRKYRHVKHLTRALVPDRLIHALRR